MKGMYWSRPVNGLKKYRSFEKQSRSSADLHPLTAEAAVQLTAGREKINRKAAGA